MRYSSRPELGGSCPEAKRTVDRSQLTSRNGCDRRSQNLLIFAAVENKKMAAPPPAVDGENHRPIAWLSPIAGSLHEVRALVRPDQAEAGNRLAGQRLAANPVWLLGRSEAAEHAVVAGFAVAKRQEEEFAGESAPAGRVRFDGEHGSGGVAGDRCCQGGDGLAVVRRPQVEKVGRFDFASIQRAYARAGEANHVGFPVTGLENECVGEDPPDIAWLNVAAMRRRLPAPEPIPIIVEFTRRRVLHEALPRYARADNPILLPTRPAREPHCAGSAQPRLLVSAWLVSLQAPCQALRRRGGHPIVGVARGSLIRD